MRLEKLSRSRVLSLFGICVLVGSLFLWYKNKPTDTIDQTNQQNFNGIEIEETKLYGTSGADTGYVIKAAHTKQINKDQHLLYTVSGKYYLDANKEKYINLLSKDGLFNPTSNKLELSNEVDVSFSGGYRLLTDHLTIDFNTMEIDSDDEVTVNGIKGKIFAKGFHQNIKQKTAHFKGPVESVIFN